MLPGRSPQPALQHEVVQEALGLALGQAGARVVREKSDGGTGIFQDLYIAGSYERRQVQLVDSGSNPVSVFNDSTPGVDYTDVDGTRLVKYAAGARIQQKYDSGTSSFEDPKIFLSFDNHLGSTSVVTDFDDGTLVEWATHYAYGAEETHWKNEDAAYDNAEEPYGFTGKEEDQEVGLHYFGARYYSAYLGRWISPDPPVVHGAAVGANAFQYGANTPYIAVDPDGNWVTVLIGAIVGSIVGSVNEVISRGGIGSFEDAGWVVLAGVRGGGIGAAAGSGNPWLAAAAATGDQQLEMLYRAGGNMSVLGQAEFHKQSAIVFSSSVASSYAGAGIGAASGNMFVRAAASYVVGVGIAATNQMVLTGEGLRGEDWERLCKDQAISSTVSFGGSIAQKGLERSFAVSGEQGNASSSLASSNRKPTMASASYQTYEGMRFASNDNAVLAPRTVEVRQYLPGEAFQSPSFDAAGNAVMEILVFEPSGRAIQSSMGHVATRIGNTVYSFEGNGMNTVSFDKYMNENSYRNAVGFRIDATPEQVEYAKMMLERNHNQNYDIFTISSRHRTCVSGPRDLLNFMGKQGGNSISPSGFAADLIESPSVKTINIYTAIPQLRVPSPFSNSWDWINK